MLVIGLTGTTGSGKGYVSDIIRSFGLDVIDTDEITHDLYKKGECANAVEKSFHGVLAPDGSVDRSELADIVFHNKDKLKILQDIVYYYISAKTDELIEKCRARGSAAVVVDAPRLFEADFDKKCDVIICVTASVHKRIKRITERDNISIEKALARINSQMTDDEYISKSDYVICNDGNENLENDLLHIMKVLKVMN